MTVLALFLLDIFATRCPEAAGAELALDPCAFIFSLLLTVGAFTLKITGCIVASYCIYSPGRDWTPEAKLRSLEGLPSEFGGTHSLGTSVHLCLTRVISTSLPTTVLSWQAAGEAICYFHPGSCREPPRVSSWSGLPSPYFGSLCLGDTAILTILLFPMFLPP